MFNSYTKQHVTINIVYGWSLEFCKVDGVIAISELNHHAFSQAFSKLNLLFISNMNLNSLTMNAKVRSVTSKTTRSHEMGFSRNTDKYHPHNQRHANIHIILTVANPDTFSYQSQFKIVIAKSYFQQTQKKRALKLVITCEIFIILIYLLKSQI